MVDELPQATLFDKLDLKILEELSDDARRPYARVAASLGVSEATVRSRIARLQRSGAIRFVTEMDPHRMGLLSAFLLLRVTGPDAKRATEAVCQVPEAIYVLPCVGNVDIVGQFVCSGPRGLDRLVNEDLRGIGVEVTQTLVTLGMPLVRYTFAAMKDEDGQERRRSKRPARGRGHRAN